MIVRAEGDELLVFRQADHARLSGRLAAAWGRPPWSPPRPQPAVVVAARQHDDAWIPYDEAPEVRDGRPLAFFEVDRQRTSALYAAGVEAVAALDAYAGLLVSLHYSGFFTSHWGWPPFSTPERFPEPQAGAIRAFLASQAGRQSELRAAAGVTGRDEAWLAHNYRLLQLWDRVSLDICRNPGDTPWAVDYPAVAADLDGPEVTLRLAMPTPRHYTLGPYPLLTDVFRHRLPVTRVSPGAPTRDAFLRTWAMAAEAGVEVVIAPT
jgi:hypothetical protein